jgi:hypothetical protein
MTRTASVPLESAPARAAPSSSASFFQVLPTFLIRIRRLPPDKPDFNSLNFFQRFRFVFGAPPPNIRIFVRLTLSSVCFDCSGPFSFNFFRCFGFGFGFGFHFDLYQYLIFADGSRPLSATPSAHAAATEGTSIVESTKVAPLEPEKSTYA